MTGLRAVAIATLLAVGTLGGVALGASQPTPSMSVQPVENGSNYFGPNASAVDRSGQATTAIDVAATVSANGGQVRSTYARVSLQRKYETADSVEARRAIVRQGTEQLETRVAALERKERSAIAQYADGTSQEGDLFRTVASVDAEAAERAETALWLRDRAEELNMADELRQLGTLRIRLVALQGPVRDDIAEGLAGVSRSRVHTDVAGGGLVLATTSTSPGEANDRDPQYVREAYSPAIRNRRATDRYEGEPFSARFNRLRELYPWVGANNDRVAGVQNAGRNGARLYWMTLIHAHGRTTPYLDGGTDRIVKEHQRLRTEQLRTDVRNASSADGALVAHIETTYASGPMGVTVVDTETNESVNATVRIDGDPVGTTTGGTVWTVAPRGTTNVTVLADDATIRTTVDAAR